MEFTIPKTPPRRVKEFPVMESSESIETDDLNNAEGEEEMNSFDEEEKENNNDTEISIQVDHPMNANVASLTPQPSARASESVDTNDESSPSFKEKINKLYGFVPEIASHFTIIKRIGEGTFSSVYLAKLKHHPEIDQMFALKHIIPTSHPCRIENELRCLLDIGGCDNVMGVKMCVRNRDHVIIVMPYFPHKKFQDYLFQMSLEEAREYMKNLLIALQRVHEFSVIHRDVKPANFLYDRQTNEYALVDFGLASGPLLVDPAKMAATLISAHIKKKPTQQPAKLPLQPPPPHSSSSLSSVKPASSSASKPNGTTTTTTNTTGHNATVTSSSAAAGTVAGVKRSPSRQPLSPLKREAGMGKQRNLSSNFITPKLIERKDTPLSASRIFAPSFSTSSALVRQSSGLCDCFGKPVICELCVARAMQVAPRAGTAGFRAPEVLLKSPNQDTGVDVWSAGVIFLSLLSARYPFFKANDDLGYLAQIISLLGSEPCIKAARSFGKLLTLSEIIPAGDLEVICQKLRGTQIMSLAQQNPPQQPTSSLSIDTDSEVSAVMDSWSHITSDAYHLLGRLLDPNPKTRITAKNALKHPFFTKTANTTASSSQSAVASTST